MLRGAPGAADKADTGDTGIGTLDMMIAPLPPDEADRLNLLADLDVLDTAPEAGFDALTLAARQATGWPISLVSLIDVERQWFKSRDGLSVAETSRDHAFCAHALHGDDLFEIPDTHADPRFFDNPLVTGPPGIRAYAGHPLVVQGIRMGTLCVIHTEPARLDAAQRVQLRALGTVAAALLTERLNRTRLTLERERLIDFAAASGDWLWESDEQHRVVWLSSGYQDATSQSAALRLGHSLPDRPLLDARGQRLHPAVSVHDLLERRQAFSRATFSSPENDGERWISLSAVPLGPAAGNARGMRGSARDVTHHVLSERARDTEAQRLRELVAMAPGLLYEFRIDSKGEASFPFTTPDLHSVFEVLPEAAAASAQSVFDRIHPDDLPNVQRSIALSHAEHSPWQSTFRVCLPLSGERHLTAHSTPKREPDGGTLWHGLVTDVTPQVLARKEREQLQRERDHAQHDARARADALSRVSHELRTPLNAILGFTQLVQGALHDDAVSSAQLQQWMLQIHRAASHQLALVNDVLDISSLEANSPVVELTVADATEVAQQALEMVRAQATLRHQHLELTGPEDEAAGSADGGRCVQVNKRALQQVLLNLLGNACKYTSVGGHIVLRCLTVGGSTLRIEVCDDGPGISSEQQAHLFQPFERGVRSNDATVGTGLGLVISRQLAQAMNGQLRLESRVGIGSVFALELPLVTGSGSAQSREPAASEASFFGGLPVTPGDSRPALPSALLLYVEDDPVNGLLMQEFAALTPPLRLHWVVDLAQGLAAAQEMQPDLVLLDMNLPDGTGYDLLRRLRADPATAHLRVVAFSADAMPSQVVKAREAGFDD